MLIGVIDSKIDTKVRLMAAILARGMADVHLGVWDKIPAAAKPSSMCCTRRTVPPSQRERERER